MSLENALQRAAGDLPEGWNILVDVERGAGCVRLYNDDGDELALPNDGGELADQVLDALQVAKEGAGV